MTPTPEQVAQWAREAGWSGIYTQWAEPTGDPDWSPIKQSLTVPVTAEQIQRFATLAMAEQAELCAADLKRAKDECDAITELNHAQWLALENVRTLAAKYRTEPWAQHMLRFCEEAGVRAQVLRANASKETP